MGSAKVIEMPEGQLVGAIERQAERLQLEAEATLRRAEAERDPCAIADEAIAGLTGGQPATRTGGVMAFGVGERPERSITPHIESVDYPADKAEIVAAAEDGEAPVDIINVLKNLPRDRYDSVEMVLRDLAEASRQLEFGGHAPAFGSLDRRNLGRDAVEENQDGNPRHP
jgi:hypothetical protein